jgi:hypothetical protein
MLKPDAIAKPKARLRPVLRPLLERTVCSYVLMRGKPKAQAATIRLRCETADLIDLREIFCANSKKYVSREFSFGPMPERNA